MLKGVDDELVELIGEHEGCLDEILSISDTLTRLGQAGKIDVRLRLRLGELRRRLAVTTAKLKKAYKERGLHRTLPKGS